MKKTVFPLIIISTLFGILFLYFSDNNSSENIAEQSLIISNDEPKALPHQERSQETAVIIEQKPASTNEAQSEELAIVDDEFEQPFSGISRPSDKAKTILEEAGVLPKDLKQEAYVEFDLDSLRALEVGDTFNLEIPQSLEMYAAEVTKIEKFNNGDKSVFGRLVGSDGVLHTTVLTVGEDAVYGQFTTVAANYVFESKGKYGWIAAKRDLYRNHVEFEAVQVGSTTEGPDDVFAPQD